MTAGALGKAIASRVAEETMVRAGLVDFARSFFDAIDALFPEMEAAGLKCTARRSESEGSLRLELEAEGLHDKILLLTQKSVGYVPEHAGAHGALYAYLVSQGSGLGVPVERFLVAKADDVHCEGVCAPLDTLDPGAIARRLIEAVWMRGRAYWTPLEAMGPVPAAELELPHLRGQLGFRPRPAVVPPAGVRSSR